MAKEQKIKVFSIGQASAVYVPQKLRGDSSYPFTEDEEKDLVMEIKGKSLVIRTRKENELIE